MFTMSSEGGSWLDYVPSFLVQESKSRQTRQRELQVGLRQNQRDLMRQKGRLESQRKEMEKAAERHVRAGDDQKARRQYQNIARVDRDIQQLDACLNDVTSMNNSSMIAGSQQKMMDATRAMTRAMNSGPGLQQQRNAIQEYSIAREQQKMNRELMQDMMYQSDSDEDDEGESVSSRANEMLEKARDKINLENGNVPLDGEEFIGMIGAPQIPTQDPAEMIRSASGGSGGKSHLTPGHRKRN